MRTAEYASLSKRYRIDKICVCGHRHRNDATEYIAVHFALGIAEAKCILATTSCVRVPVPRRILTLLHEPGYNLGEW